jgi:ElaB/YqjD/DUF883 family membrane-anchored ribosome-binding protein
VLGVNRSPGDTTESFGEQVQDALSAARQSAATSAQAVREGASDALGHLSSAAHDARDQLAQTRQVAQQKVGEAFSTVTDNPVMLGALSLAVGAFLGALIPQSRQEQSALGDLAKRTREAASDLAQGAVDRGGAAVKQALDAGRDTAQAQGLSGNTPVKDIVQGITDGELRRDLTQVATDALHAGARALHADPGAASTSSTAPVGTAAQD